MDYSVYKISLDIHKPEAQEVLEMKLLDSKRRIQISLTENGKVYQITPDCKAMFSAGKSDGNKIYNQCEIVDNTIIYDVTQQTLACLGEVDCEVQLLGSDEAVITSPRFSIIVHDRVYNGEDIVDSETETDVLPDLIAKSHEHDNKNTLDGFYCEAAEYVPPEGDFPIGGGAVKSSRLNYGNEIIRYVSDGDVIESVEKTDTEVKINLAPTDTGNGVIIPKDPIVIPLGGNSGSNTGGGLTPEQAAQLEANTAARHEHKNKALLDTITKEMIAEEIPAVHILPFDAKDGDMCLYAPMNTITPEYSGKKIYFDWKEFSKPLVDKTQVINFTLQNDDGTYVNAELYRDSTDCSFVISNVYDRRNNTGIDVIFTNGELDTQNSAMATRVDGKREVINFNSIDELPLYWQLLQFDTIEVYASVDDIEVDVNEIDEPFFYSEYRLMKYQGGEWVEVFGTSTKDYIDNALVEINARIDEVAGGYDEIEAMIDESGVLDE